MRWLRAAGRAPHEAAARALRRGELLLLIGPEEGFPKALARTVLTLGLELRLPGSTEIIADPGGLGEKRVLVQPLVSAVDLNVHAPGVGALIDVDPLLVFHR